MVPKKEKRKKKKNPEEDDDEDSPDKYLAYVIKPKKRKVAVESVSVASTSKTEPPTEKQKIKKKKVKNQKKSNDSKSINQNDSDSTASASISAKPQLYQETRQTKATKSTAKKTAKVKNKNKTTSQKTLNDSLANWTVDDATGIDIITPKANMKPMRDGKEVPMEYAIPKKFEYDIDYKSNFNYDMKPVVYEAVLKKPSSYYIPRVLRDEIPKQKKAKSGKGFQDIFTSLNKKIVETGTQTGDGGSCVDLEIQTDPVNSTDQSATATASKTAESSKTESSEMPNTTDTKSDETPNTKENAKGDSSADMEIENNPVNSTDQPATDSKITESSKTESNETTNTTENPNTELSETSITEDPNIPEALKEFYEEVTKQFENLTTKAAGGKKKSKQKSALTVDKSVTDERTLANIVSRKTFQIENAVSTYQQNIAKFFSLESKVILVLCPEAQFSFLGKIKIQVLYGAVELYGTLFNSRNTLKPAEVYSPRGYSSISVSTSSSNGTHDKEALWDCLTSEGVDRSLKTKLHDAIQECKDGWSVLLLENFENTLTTFLNSYSSFKLFPRIDNMRYSWCDPKRAECVLQANFQFTSSEDEISICPQWNENVTKQLLEQWQLTKSMTIVITGGKGVGKSTTARYLINNLLRHSEKVVLLDLDIGQAEMTPPGCVSLNVIDEPLLGPNFTHLKMPYYQLYLEDVSVTNCMTRYTESAKKLVECLKSKKDLSQYPVVVNTMGFCKGIGLDICIFLIKLIQPSNIVQIMSKRPKNNFEFALLKQTINEYKTSSIFLGNDDAVFEKSCDYELHYVPSMAEGKRQFETWNMEPRQQRELVLLSYLSQIISNADDKNLCNFTSCCINNIVPYTLPFSSFYVTLMKSSVSPTHILAAMNGNIVALCGADLDDETSEEDKEALNYPMVVIKPPLCTCYGYGIVRGIDMKRRQVYINTPLKESELRHVNLLVGCAPVPFALLHGDAPYAGDRGELPTSREPRRGNFRVDQSRNARMDVSVA